MAHLIVYDPQAGAKTLSPTVTPLRNRLPRKPLEVGSPAVTLGEEDTLNKPTEDDKTTSMCRLLLKLMAKEEVAILGGNKSLRLARPDAPVLTVSGEAREPFALAVVALTFDGFRNSSVGSGVATRMTVTGADGATYTFFGGSSNASSISSAYADRSGIVAATVVPVRGALAYAWFAQWAEGPLTLQKITTTNQVSFDTLLNEHTQPLSKIVEDCSISAEFAYDGLLASAFLAEDAYLHVCETNASLTTTSNGFRLSVAEIDHMLEGMWRRGLETSSIFVNAQEWLAIARLLKRREEDFSYPLPYSCDKTVALILHPFLPPGTIIGLSDGRIAPDGTKAPPVIVRTRQEYYSVQWPNTHTHGAYVEEWLDVREPAAIGIITNISTLPQGVINQFD